MFCLLSLLTDLMSFIYSKKHRRIALGKEVKVESPIWLYLIFIFFPTLDIIDEKMYAI